MIGCTSIYTSIYTVCVFAVCDDMMYDEGNGKRDVRIYVLQLYHHICINLPNVGRGVQVYRIYGYKWHGYIVTLVY